MIRELTPLLMQALNTKKNSHVFITNQHVHKKFELVYFFTFSYHLHNYSNCRLYPNTVKNCYSKSDTSIQVHSHFQLLVNSELDLLQFACQH